MKREDTRYKGVWDAGYAAAMADADRLLERAAHYQLAFAPPSPREFDMNRIRMRLTGPDGAALISEIVPEAARFAIYLGIQRLEGRSDEAT